MVPRGQASSSPTTMSGSPAEAETEKAVHARIAATKVRQAFMMVLLWLLRLKKSGLVGALDARALWMKKDLHPLAGFKDPHSGVHDRDRLPVVEPYEELIRG